MLGLHLSGIGSAIISPSRGVAPLSFLSSMPSGVTYSRSGGAVAQDSAGLVTSFAADAPQLTDLGLLLEPAATNLALRSQEIGTSPWAAGGTATFTANAGVAPDGTTTADAILSPANNNQHRADQTTTIAAAQHTFSVYLKPFGYNYTRLRIGSNGAFFDLLTGEASELSVGVTARSEPAANGFRRYIITVAATAGNDILRINTQSAAGSAGTSFVGDGVSGVLAWGAQLETGAIATSYIATAGATASRSLPSASIAVPAGITAARVAHGSAYTNTTIRGLTPGGSFDLVTGRTWVSLGQEIKSLDWMP